ncbi:hypothetical protein M9Y10_034001 [Tritrichomonas musculus]|uniref:Protein kinase domain-containing protein n=1 Tax=Tritrichomonas musculus TaxID=1915356 RepID=A0ABR2KDS1_9EUKA
MMENSIRRFELDINYFEKGKKLGKGGFGHVFMAHEKINKRILAAKILNYNESDKEAKTYIYREIEIMMFANHPTIIKFYGYTTNDFNDENNVTILMEYTKNGSLASILEKIHKNEKPEFFTNTKKQMILAGIVCGMKYLHSCNIIHRDIKPGNILLDENYKPRITDFGLSKYFDHNQSKKQTMHGGTLEYMAPEVIEEDPYGIKADVYSFGILLYQVITELVPYPELENGKIKPFRFSQLVVNYNYRPKFDKAKNIKESLKNLMVRCWSANPDERPSFTEIFNKLTKYDSKDNCFLDDVNIDEFNEYIKAITSINDPIQNLINKIEQIENDNAILRSKNLNLSIDKKKLQQYIDQIKNEKEKLQRQITKLQSKSNASYDSSTFSNSSNSEELSNCIIHQPIITKSQIMEKATIDRSKPILGIDLGTSYSTIGIARNNFKGKPEINIISNYSCISSNLSVVCIVDGKIYVGEEAMKKSSKYPKNLIYDTKRMLGKKYDDPLIQKYKKSWTFDIVPSKEREILIKVDNKYYEPYQISGMILIELMNLANSQLDDQTNQAIITIPAYFSKEQIDDTKKAAKYANIELIELLKEPLAATYFYSFKNKEFKTSDEKSDILIYDFGGGTLDVSYVEINKNSFNILATAGDPNLGGQDFTNSIFELISPKLDEIYHSEWQKNSKFVKNVREQCEKAKIHFTASTDFEFYFEIQSNQTKSKERAFEYRLCRDEFHIKAKPLFDRCMNPVHEILNQIDKDTHQIDDLILVGGSSYLPIIGNKLYELTNKRAYHGVSAVESVAYGACIKGLSYLK